MTLGTDIPESAASSEDGREQTAPARRRRWWLIGVVVLVAGGGGAAYYYLENREPAAPTAASTTPAASAPITRGDVVDTESVEGKLTYPNSRPITAGGSGVVTSTPAEGGVVERGKALYKVDNRPIVLMYGKLPLYRSLYDGVDNGPDVRQLETNLQALGFGDGMTVDNHYSDATADAVEEWQDDMGLSETGRVDDSQIVFQTGSIRVSEIKAQVGQRVAAGSTVLTVNDTRPIVHIDLDAGKQSLAKKGAAVKVTLPNGKTAGGRISAVGTVAQTTGTGDNETSTIGVDVTLSSGDTGGLDQAPVTVDMESARAKNVLSVPIEALLGLREGGFGLEVVEGDTSRIVPVRIGAFGSGRVQVTGDGLREGMKVGVPSS